LIFGDDRFLCHPVFYIGPKKFPWISE